MKRIQIFRDFNSLSKRQQIAVGIGNTALGAILMLVMDTSLGLPVEDSIRNILITLAAGAAFLFVYGRIQKRRMQKEIK